MKRETQLRHIPRSIAALVLGAVLSLPVVAQESLPDSPALVAGKEFLTVFNAGDHAGLERFVASRLSESALRVEPAAARVGELLLLRQSLGPIQAVEISGVRRALVINVRAANGLTSADLLVLTAAIDDADDKVDDLRLFPDAWQPAEAASVAGAAARLER